MFQGNQIQQLVTLFNNRGVELFHSAQYIDSISYMKLGGIPSRSLLEAHQLEMTEFVSDLDDHKNGVWDKVFLNPQDFGQIFAKCRNGVPTVYGPIAFVFKPDALLQAEDIALCLRSAGSKNFNRASESLNINDVEGIFSYKIDVNFSHLNSRIRNRDQLSEKFNRTRVSNPEISLTIKGNLLPFDSTLINIVVDPYIINETCLVDRVQQLAADNNITTYVKQRFFNQPRYDMAKELVQLLLNGVPTLENITNNTDLSSSLREWAQKIQKSEELCIQWNNYANYFRNGTLLPIMKKEVPF